MSKSSSGCEPLNPWLQEMLDAGLDPIDVKTLIRLFLDTAPAVLTEAQEYLERGDMKGTARAAHRLVGGAANVGVFELESVARELERTSEAGERAQAIGFFVSVSKEYAAAQKELELASATLGNAGNLPGTASSVWGS
jgi:HPt (histidine-containing phosphotransfer) domain-containing protein